MPAAPGTGVLDELLWTLLGLGAAFLLLSGPIVGWLALLRLRGLRAELEDLRAELRARPAAAPAAPGGEAATEPTEAAEPVAAAERVRRFGVLPEVPLDAGPAPAATDAEAEPTPAASPAPAPAPRGDVESRLAERWLVWLGGLALAMGALFLAGWAVEQGLLGPGARVGLAYLTGIGLLVLAEQAWRRRPSDPTAVYLVPAALAAGAVTALYGATLAAHLLWELVPRVVAFALLALTSALATGLALRYGALLALLGGLGAFAAPLLVGGDTAEPWPVAVYLAAVVGALALVAGLRRWAWLAGLDLVGALLWAILLLATPEALAAPGAPGLHLLATGLAGLGLLAVPGEEGRRTRRVGGTLLVLATLLQLALLAATDHAAGALASLALATLAATALALRLDAQRWVAAVLAGATLLAAALWSIPGAREITSQLHDPSVALEPAFWLAPEARPLALALALLGALWAGLGFTVLFRRPHPGFWAALSGFAPVAALAVAHARLEAFGPSPPLAAVGLGLALLLTVPARLVAGRPPLATALAAYAVAAASALALALAIALEAAWLTVALALELAALARVAERLALPALRLPAAVLALVVLARLLLALELTGPSAGLVAILWAHGVPLLALAVAARLFDRVPAPPVAGLEAVLATLALLFWLLLVTQLLRRLTGAESEADLGRLALLAPSALTWLLTALVLWRLGAAGPDPAIRWLGHLVAAVAVGKLALLVLPANPALTGEPVGPWPLLNLLLVAYLAPALLALGIARRAGGGPGAPPAALALPAAVASVGLGLLWLTLEVRRAFQGSVLTGSTSDAEWLAWSLAWLAFAGLLLILGVRRRVRWLRAAALVVGGLAILKAFLFDLGELEGLYRALSFLGLGLCLVGVGFLYRRYVAAAPAAT